MKLIKKMTLPTAATGLCLASSAAISETEGYLSILPLPIKVEEKGHADPDYRISAQAGFKVR